MSNLEKSRKIILGAGDKWKDKIAEHDVWYWIAMVYKSQKEYLFFPCVYPINSLILLRYKKAIECLKRGNELFLLIDYLTHVIVVPHTDCFDYDSLRDYGIIAKCYAKIKNYKKACRYLEKVMSEIEGDLLTM